MAGPPPMPEDARDASHLRTLSILHYVYAGLGILVLFFIGLHYLVMQTVGDSVERSLEKAKQKHEENAAKLEGVEPLVDDPDGVVEKVSKEELPEIPTEFVETIFDSLKWLYLIAVVWIVLLMILNFLVGRYLNTRRNRVFIIVVSCFNCLSIPVGLGLGVATLIVLSRPSMRISFGESPISSG